MADIARTIAIGSDHFGLPLKRVVREHLRSKGYTVDDFGVESEAPVDYPDIAEAVSEQVAAGRYGRAVLICGTGAGMAIAANKLPGVRAVSVSDPYTAERARASNDAQVITLGSQVLTPEVALRLVDIWLGSEFQGGRSAPKVEKLKRLDEKYRRPTAS